MSIPIRSYSALSEHDDEEILATTRNTAAADAETEEGVLNMVTPDSREMNNPLLWHCFLGAKYATAQ